MNRIPAFDLDGKLFESSPMKDDRIPDTMTWHRSFAPQEGQRLCKTEEGLTFS